MAVTASERFDSDIDVFEVERKCNRPREDSSREIAYSQRTNSLYAWPELNAPILIADRRPHARQAAQARTHMSCVITLRNSGESAYRTLPPHLFADGCILSVKWATVGQVTAPGLVTDGDSLGEIAWLEQ